MSHSMAVRGRAVSAEAGVSAAGGFLRKKLNMGWACGPEVRPAPEASIDIIAGSGALAQSVRATES